MADVTLKYKKTPILEMSDSGSATLKTGGKYCEDDIAVEYVKPVEETVRSKWYRAPDMPDYDSLIDKSIFERDENGAQYQINAFLTVATKIPGADTFRINTYSNAATIDVGVINMGVFNIIDTVAADNNQNFSFNVSDYAEEHDYIVVHIVLNSGFPYIINDAIAWSTSNPKNGLSPIVEIYGLWDGFAISEVNYSPLNIYSVRYATIYGKTGIRNTSGYMYVPSWVEVIDLSSAKQFILSGSIGGAESLKQLLLPHGLVSVTDSATECFVGCISLESLDLSGVDFSLITTLKNWFSGCYSLRTLDLSNVDLSSITNTVNMFLGCFSLVNIILDNSVLPSVSFSLSKSPLSNESLAGVVNALPIVSGDVTITLGNDNIAKLTSEQLNIITNTKGWTVA